MSCSKLEDYLCGDLAIADCRAFEAHTRVCETCAEAVELEQQLMSRLREASTTLEHPVTPTVLQEQAPTAPRRARLALATSVVAMIVFMVILSRPPSPPADDVSAKGTLGTVAASPTVQLPAGQSAASIPSGDPNIRILMVFNGPSDATGPDGSLLHPTDREIR